MFFEAIDLFETLMILLGYANPLTHCINHLIELGLLIVIGIKQLYLISRINEEILIN